MTTTIIRDGMKLFVVGICLYGMTLRVADATAADKPPIPDFTKGATIDLTQEGMPVDWNLGVTGARGWMYGWWREATVASRQILITKVDKGSPADGILQKGDVILGIGNTPFASDAREAFGRALTAAETREGKGALALIRWRAGKTENVVVPLPVLGSYSATTPWECEKSRKILDAACRYLVTKADVGEELSIPALVKSLALMATGDTNYLPIVRSHIASIVSRVAASGGKPPVWEYESWSWAYANVLLCEYYFLTHDDKVLPAIRAYTMALALGQGSGGNWGHGMTPHDPVTGTPRPVDGYGSMNQITTICWMSLSLAQRCGVTDPEIERAIARSHAFLAYFINIGSITYGEDLAAVPGALSSLHDDNGKNSAAAVAFALVADKEGMQYFSRMTVASHQEREYGHTGNYFSLLWGALGAARSGPRACGAFIREHAWVYDLERRWDGGFVYQGQGGNGNGYDPQSGRQRSTAGHCYPDWDTTGARILMYCLPLKKLVITGRDLPATELTAAEVADTIEAPRVKHGSLYTREELLNRVGSWSPVVRMRTAQDLASRIRQGDIPLSVLTDKLRGKDQYARYGACVTLKYLGPKAQPAFDDLRACLGSTDRALRINAVSALGYTDDARAVAPLLAMTDSDSFDDPFDLVHRYLATALFEEKDSLKTKALGADRELLLKATRRFLRSSSAQCRTIMALNVVNTLSFAEVKKLWPDLMYACDTNANGYNTFIQMEVLRIMADNHVKEGIDRCVWYLTNMKEHGSQDRVPVVLDYLRRYGAHAKSTVPRLKEIAAYFEAGPDDFPKDLSLGKAVQVRDTIRALEATDDTQKDQFALVSIEEKK